MIVKDEHGNITITGDDIHLFQLLALKGALKLNVDHGLRMSRGYSLKGWNVRLGTNFRTNKQLLAYLEENLK